MLEVTIGNLFTTSHQTIVNTVNCVGVMGAGIALECRLRYPVMFEKYCELCKEGKLRPGTLWLYKGGEAPTDIDNRWVLNFPTKDNWKFPSRFEYLEAGLDKFILTYHEKGITSVAFPVLGGLNGGLDPDHVIDLMTRRLGSCDIPITIYQYSSTASDDLYNRFKANLLESDPAQLAKQAHVRRGILDRVLQAVESDGICQMNQLARIQGVGAKTMESLFRYLAGNARSKCLTQGEFDL